MIGTYEGAAAKGRLSTLLSKAVPAWQTRPDSEHEQAVIRLVVGLVASAYLLFLISAPTSSLPIKYVTIFGIAIFFIAAIGIMLWLVINPAVSPR